MVHSASKSRMAARPRFTELLLLSVACLPIAAEAASQEVRDEKALEMEMGSLPERKSVDARKRPLVRQEGVPETLPDEPVIAMVEVDSRGSVHITSSQHHRQGHGKHHRHRQDPNNATDLGHGDMAALPQAGECDPASVPDGSQCYTQQCENYGGCTDLTDCVTPSQTLQTMCSGDCKETMGFPEARDNCCNCNGGAQFRMYTDSQCIGESGLSAPGRYHGQDLQNPHQYSTPRECMMACWRMGENCSGISIINSGSEFAGKCYFRKGVLNYVHNYKGCYDPVCSKLTADMTAAELSTGNNNHWDHRLGINESDTRLPFCTDGRILANIECTDNRAEALPNTITRTVASPTQDEVVDDRDCWVKFLWWR